MTNAELKQRLEADPFYDPNSTHLDYPTWDAPEAAKCDDPFECAVKEVATAKDLKNFISGLGNDREALQELARSNPELASQLDQARPRKFYAGDWLCIATPRNDGTFHVVATNTETSQKRKLSVVANDVEGAMSLAGQILAKPKSQLWRELTPEQLLMVIRLCQVRDTASAVYTYLNFAIGGLTDADISTDPKYLPLTNRIAWFVFENSEPQFTEAAHPFVEQFCGDKPLTVDLLKTAFKAYEKEQGFVERDRLLGFNHPQNEPAETDDDLQTVAEQLEALDDAGVEDAFNATLRHRAKTARRVPGILA
jgi:hypothetical protein